MFWRRKSGARSRTFPAAPDQRYRQQVRGNGTRLMTYNVLDGGAGRLETLAAVVQREASDVLALNEANGLDAPGRSRPSG